MRGNRGRDISSFFPKALLIWASSVLYEDGGSIKKPKDKQISSHCISVTAIYIYIYIYMLYIYVYEDEN